MKTMAIDFVRQVLDQTLLIEHMKNLTYFGGRNQVNIFSFYEQVEQGYEVDRYNETYDELVKQQNRSGLILNGVLIAPETPQIMNVHSHDIVPMNFNLGFRLKIKDRDSSIETLDNLCRVLKGRKRDVACFKDGKLLMVGTMANNVLGEPQINKGDFLGLFNSASDYDAGIKSLFVSFGYASAYRPNNGDYFYIEDTNHTMKVVIYNSTSDKFVIITDDGTHPNVIFPPSNKTFDKYKLSLSFDTQKIDQPYTLNGDEDVIISFGGSATLVSAEVELGNDLTKVSLQKKSIKAKTTITITDTKHYLEPLEMPNNLGIANELSQLTSSNFIQSKQNTGINPTISYSFVLDKSEPLIKQLWKYGRYGIQGLPTDSPTYSNGVTPNMIYELVEYWSSWGVVEKNVLPVKVTESVEGENTESDVLTLKITLEVQPNGDSLWVSS